MTGPPPLENNETPCADAAAVYSARLRIQATEPFYGDPPLTRLLILLVEEALAGRGVAGVATAQLGHLRESLLAYYAGEGRQDPVRIHLTAGGTVSFFSRRVGPFGALPVRPLPPPPVPQPPQQPRPPEPPPQLRARPGRWWWWIAPAAGALALLFWAGTLWYARAASAAVRSLAVVPFADPLKPRDEAFRQGLTGEIIDALSRQPELRVVSQSSAASFGGQRVGVDAELFGSLRQAAGHVELSVQLRRAADGYTLWSAQFGLPPGDLSPVARQLARGLAARLQIHPVAPPAPPHQPPPQAYHAYLEGRELYRQTGVAALDPAVERLETATSLDPDFAQAWAWLSMVRGTRVEHGLARPNQAMPASRDAAERAVALDPACADAHLALAIVEVRYDWDWAAARDHLERALALGASPGVALQWRARWWRSQGNLPEALADLRRALAYDPLSPAILNDLADGYVALHQPEQAVPLARQAAALRPDDAEARAQLATLLWSAGQTDESRRLLRELRAAPGGGLPTDQLALLAARQGDPAVARQLLDQAEDAPLEDLRPGVAYAEFAAVLRDWDRMFAWMEDAQAARDPRLPYLRGNPDIPQSDPRFAAYLAYMNLPAR